MAANKSLSSETSAQTRHTKKQDKALEERTLYSSEPWNKPSLSEIQRLEILCRSAPWDKPSLNEIQVKIWNLERLSNSCISWGEYSANKPNLKELRSLTECIEFIKELQVEVNDISQLKHGSKMAVPEGGATESRSLENSRSLIIHWAKELDQINMLKKETKLTDGKMRGTVNLGGTEKSLEKQNERLLQWALELKNVREANGLSDEELRKLLCPGGVKESRLTAILPLLEFVVWSLLSQETKEDICKLWLPAKQKAWRTGSRSPKYIPNSVWQWIHSASVSVQLDPSTSHPWLVFSDNRLQVQEAAVLQRSSTTVHTAQCFDGWPCVLGDTVFTVGRHYWVVEVSRGGSWRMGVTLVSARRKQKFNMSPSTGYWILWKSCSSLWACTDKPTKLQGVAVPRLVGVYVDVGEGQVSFYDVDCRAHIFTFSHAFRDSLVPVFGCLDGDTVLKIIPAEMPVSAPVV